MYCVITFLDNNSNLIDWLQLGSNIETPESAVRLFLEKWLANQQSRLYALLESPRFRAFSYAQAESCSQALSTPARQQVKPTVGLLFAK
jgi:hypothetical protein